MRFSLGFGEIYEQTDVTWMDKPFHLLLPRVNAIQIGVMAKEQAQASTSNNEEDEMAWVADEPRNTISKFSLTGGEWHDQDVAVFKYLHLTPSQLHPNSLAFIRAFEMTAAYLGFLPTIPLFFHAFHLQRSRPKGDIDNKFGWVSLKQKVKLFEMFLESVRVLAPAKDGAGAPLVGPDGRPVMDDYSCFPLSWRKSHYLKPASDFVYSAEELTMEELSNYEQLKVFVGGFPRKYYEDEDGNPVLYEVGVPVTKKAFIDTRKLLACRNMAETEVCFRTFVVLNYALWEISTIAAKLRKSKNAQEKRQAAGLGTSSTTAPPPTPGGDNIENASGNAVIVNLEDSGRNVEHQACPPKVAESTSPKLVKKSSVALSDAEKAIMNDMGPETLKNELTDAMVAVFKLMEISSFLNGRECKYLAERDTAKEEVALVTQRLEQAKVNHAAYREKFKLQAGLVTKLGEKEAEAVQLATEKEELEGQIKDLTTKALAAAPDADELVVDPNGEYKGFTRAALVSRIFEFEAQQLDIAKSSFDSAVAQLMVLNPGVDLVVAGASKLKEVQDGVIVSPSPDEED
ncbi:hypothetical protein TSUD_186840 [Trifolium subterraneum]|uniref:Uncharacterized protein n=1 Tax=Trifolium subterraneum TaxID=3900 RepID=A0A2Z6NWV3_TRISU|nr:hypothetical protein TSUD_186840 [Trifolium subterraneum]